MTDQILNPAVIGFYGYSKSGKTSLISRIIADFKQEGISIAVIKCTNKAISSEPIDKDTSGFRIAGAALSVFSSTIETSYVFPSKMDSSSIIDRVKALCNVHLILIEGADDPQITKIKLGKISERENTIFTYDDDYVKLKTFIKCLIKQENG